MEIKNIIIHCSDSTFGCMREIDRWHKEKGWDRVGYHLIIMNGYPTEDYFSSSLNGQIEVGRYITEVGAHAYGHNQSSLGICLISKGGQITGKQIKSLLNLCGNLLSEFKLNSDCILGHYETAHAISIGKTCPDFDVSSIRKSL